MSKYCPENVKMKRAYAFFLETADGKQAVTVDAALKAIERFEASTNQKPFRKFHIEQVRAFRSRLVEETGRSGKGLSAATITSTLKHLRHFFLWLSREPGFRSALNSNDANYFTPSEQDRRIAGARRERPVPTLDEINATLAAMRFDTQVEKRDRAAIAFAIVSGARIAAIASFRLKHVNLEARTIFHDARNVQTKGRKTFTSTFFPVGSAVAIVEDYVRMLKEELGFGPDDPLFPSTRMGHDADRSFEVQGLSREPWSGGEPIRRIFRTAFTAASLSYANPHSFRTTLTRLGERLCRTPEEWKAWSQNLGHESETTTFVGYGHVPTHRQTEIMHTMSKPRSIILTDGLNIAALEAFVESAKSSSTVYG
jgi:integrase